MPSQVEFEDDDPKRLQSSPPDQNEFEEDPPLPRRYDRWDTLATWLCLGSTDEDGL